MTWRWAEKKRRRKKEEKVNGKEENFVDGMEKVTGNVKKTEQGTSSG